MSFNADNLHPSEFPSQQRIKVDLELPIGKIFPGLSNLLHISLPELEKEYTREFRNIVAMPNIQGQTWELAFRSKDEAHRTVTELPYGSRAFMVNKDASEAHVSLSELEKIYGKKSQVLLYDTLLDNEINFSKPDQINNYISHLKELLDSEGYMVVQLTDKIDPSHNRRVLAACEKRFGESIGMRPFEIVGKYLTTGKLYIYRKSANINSTPTTSAAEGLPTLEEAVDAAEQILRRNVSVGAGEN